MCYITGVPLFYRFVTAMPNGAVFITFSFILRAVEGVGTAMYSTASYALLTQLFSEHKGMIVVSQLMEYLLPSIQVQGGLEICSEGQLNCTIFVCGIIMSQYH